jgi:hypothetical protein
VYVPPAAPDVAAAVEPAEEEEEEEEEEQAATPAPSTVAATDRAAILRRVAHGRNDRGVEFFVHGASFAHRCPHVESVRGIGSDDCRSTGPPRQCPAWGAVKDRRALLRIIRARSRRHPSHQLL